jgi:hypothetical protein
MLALMIFFANKEIAYILNEYKSEYNVASVGSR